MMILKTDSLAPVLLPCARRTEAWTPPVVEHRAVFCPEWLTFGGSKRDMLNKGEAAKGSECGGAGIFSQ